MLIELVIPTMLKSEHLRTMLPRYQNNPYVTRIHLIDNTCGEFLKQYDTKELYKLEVTTPVKNMYVNPSWNYGVSRCKQNSIVGILNDDILFDDDVFEYIIYFSENMGILGMHNTNFETTEKAYEIVDIPHHCFGWGTAIFIEKRDWVIIPDELKIFYGDTWMFHNNPIKCKALKGVPMKESNMSMTTTSPELIDELRELHKQDIQAWDKLGRKESRNWDAGK